MSAHLSEVIEMRAPFLFDLEDSFDDRRKVGFESAAA